MRKKVAIIGALVFCAVLIEFSYSFWKVSDKIYPGVFVENIDLSYLTKEEAKQKIEETYLVDQKNRSITTEINDNEFEISFSDLGVQYNTDEIIEKSFDEGRDENIFKSYIRLKKKSVDEFKLSFNLDEEAFKQYIDNIKCKACRCSEDAKIEINNGDIKVYSEVIGLELEEDKLREDIINKLMEDHGKDNILVVGEIKEIIPRILEKDLKSIDSVISSYETSLYNSGESRNKNIEISTKAVNGTLVMPGDEFSFNKIVGARTSNKGYENAKVIVNDKYQDDVGGGVCQVSSTLHNAIIRTDINPTERHGHSKLVSYVDKGYDATVSYGYLDYKFINTLPYPIYIEGNVKSNLVYFKIYSAKSINSRRYEIRTVNEKLLKPHRIIQEDGTKGIGYTEIKQQGEAGWSADIYRYIYEEGELVDKKLIYNVNIKPKDEIVIIGVKK